jgi:hypothetical protein
MPRPWRTYRNLICNWIAVGTMAMCVSFAVQGFSVLAYRHATVFSLPLVALALGALLSLRRNA